MSFLRVKFGAFFNCAKIGLCQHGGRISDDMRIIRYSKNVVDAKTKLSYSCEPYSIFSLFINMREVYTQITIYCWLQKVSCCLPYYFWFLHNVGAPYHVKQTHVLLSSLSKMKLHGSAE